MLRGKSVCVLVGVLAALVAAVTGGAAVERTAACPAPKPLPASLKRPPSTASATQLASFVLALPQRKPCDVNLFMANHFNGAKGIYPQGRPMKPASGPAPTEASVRTQLASHMKGSPHRAAALALYGRADVKTKLPDPTLRAAVAALRGTLAEPVIAYFLSARYVQPPSFCACIPYQTNIGAATGSNAARVIFFNARYRNEHFALLSGIMAHEILHQNSGNAAPVEEAILNAVTALVHAQILSREPALATRGTELSRQLNTWPLLLLNSRPAGSARIAIVAPNGRGTAPGSPLSGADFWSHAKFFHGLGNSPAPGESIPAPALLAPVLRKVLAPGKAFPRPFTFSLKMAQALSPLNDTWLSPVDRLRVNVLLGLVSVEEILRYTGLTRAKAIATFKLAPILAAQR